MLLTVKSRVGNQGIDITGITVIRKDSIITFQKNNQILSLDLEKNSQYFEIDQKDNLLFIFANPENTTFNKRLTNGKRLQKYLCGLFGLYRQKMNNLCIGLNEGYARELSFVGVQFEIIKNTEKFLELDVGLSHHKVFPKKSNVEYITIDKKKLSVKGICKESVMQETASIAKLAKKNHFREIGIFDSAKKYIFKTKKKK